ncbi:hypothetical protein NMY3_02698 [Candidatus Nitrosocosmicus oleophilus]|jgi:predicted flavoprotein YhiN|uniref:Uncharacterized protein n=1 Tax=Candidatus Nitrosocosmicus oleophilus TaxID=1353260 RepID=A0A654LZK7_9ARCH|nr:hypothetical protein [Candidatus Nitrosocosmicus oleophilus]ALI36888.1 hypothetical protein NMY3_02698 [Candidatus Nitrosocosmicus oleophilus]
MNDVCITSCNSDHFGSSESLLKEWKNYIFISKFSNKALRDLFCSEGGSQKDDTEGQLFADSNNTTLIHDFIPSDWTI